MVNAVVRPVLVFFTFPITILTLGLFLLVINGLMIELVAHFLADFTSPGWNGHSRLAGGELASWVISWFVGPAGFEVVAVRR